MNLVRMRGYLWLHRIIPIHYPVVLVYLLVYLECPKIKINYINGLCYKYDSGYRNISLFIFTGEVFLFSSVQFFRLLSDTA